MPNTPPNQSLLLILPDPDERARLVAILGRAGYPVGTADAGLQGCRLAAVDQPRLVVADVDLPDMDGYACCRLLKADPATRTIPLILLGRDAGPRERVAGLTLGAVDFLAKPYDLDELLARIRVHLGLMPRPVAGPGPETVPARSLARDLDELVVATACRVIDAHLADLPSLPEIARAAGTYRERLNALFQQRLGRSVFEHVRERRFERAAQLLRETDLDVAAIARVVGFRNARNFSTAFRERHGVAPLAYRRWEAKPGAPTGTDSTA
jgi:CheY-like chemotaxis protein/AraC-like DNA-binding protein